MIRLFIIFAIILQCSIASAFSTTASVVEDCSSTTDWTDYSGDFNNTSGACYSNNGGASSIGIWNTSTVSGNFEVYYTNSTSPGGTSSSWIGVINTGTFNGYSIQLTKAAGTDTVRIDRYDGGVKTTIASVSQEVSNGDLLMLRKVGNVLYGYYGASSTTLSIILYVVDTNYTASSDALVSQIEDSTGRIDNIGFGTFSGRARRVMMSQ